LSGWIVLKQGGNGVAKDWVSGMKMIRIWLMYPFVLSSWFVNRSSSFFGYLSLSSVYVLLVGFAIVFHRYMCLGVGLLLSFDHLLSLVAV
jgi:hypothetical protein